jgi:carboxypeptidase C (cathepsin A)
MEDVATDFYYALKELYQNQNGCLNKIGITPDLPLFIFGESYAGKYAPAIAQKIKQEQLTNSGFLTGLKGVGIGDGFTHPYAILSQAGEYAYNLGLIDNQERAWAEHMILNATYQERRKYYNDMHDTFDDVLEMIVDLAGGVNIYDITSYKEYPTKLLEEFFGNEVVQNIYKLNPDIEYAAQSSMVY